MPGVLITSPYPPELLGELSRRAEIFMPAPGEPFWGYDRIARHAAGLAAVITQGEVRIDAALIAAAPRLQIVANASIGTNNLDPDALRRGGVWGTNTPHAFVDATADCTLGLLLNLARRLGEAERFVRAGHWTRFEPGRWDGLRLRGLTLGVVGFGRIGRAVARRAEAFGLRVIHHTRSNPGAPGWRPLDELLAESDFVSLHLPLNDASRNLIDAGRLAAMKPTAFLINMARGGVVEPEALIAALRAGRLAGAALDVFADEPLVPLELRQMENVVLTPHLGGGSIQGRAEAQSLCVDNVLRVLSGGEPRADCIAVRPDKKTQPE